MTRDDIPMWEDPEESSALRQLLRAGRVEHSDYDVEAGLARHLSQLQGSAPVPSWAVKTTLQKSAGWTTVLPWLLPPVVAVGVVGAWMSLRPAEPALATLNASSAVAAVSHAERVGGLRSAAQAESADQLLLQPEAAPSPEPEHEEDVDAVGASAVAAQARDESSQRDRRDHRATGRAARNAQRSVAARRTRAELSDSDRRESGDGKGTVGPEVESHRAMATAAVGGARAGSDVTVSPSAHVKQSGADAAADETAAVAVPEVPRPEREQDPSQTKAQEPQPEKEQAVAAVRVDEVSGTRLEREMRMLAVAQRVLTDDAERSLRLCRQGEREFRGSMFSAERKQVALLALVQLGRLDEARREGIPFLRAFPNAPWSARLREALASGRVPTR